MASPVILENHTLYHWRDGTSAVFFIPAINLDPGVTFSVIQKSDANLEIESITRMATPTSYGDISFTVRWSGTPLNSIGSGNFTLRATNPDGTFSNSQVNVVYLGRNTQQPITDPQNYTLFCQNGGSVDINSAMFVTFPNNVPLLGLLSPSGHPGDGTHISSGTNAYNAFHARMTSGQSAKVWNRTNNTLPFNNGIQAAAKWRLTSGTSSGSYGSVENLTITGVATATTLEGTIPTYNLIEDKNGIYREILYNGLAPESISTSGFPSGFSIEKRNYRYFIRGNAQANTAGYYTCRLTSFSEQPSFNVSILPPSPVIIEPTPGQAHVIKLVRGRPMTPFTLALEPYNNYGVDWYPVENLPAGLSLTGNNTGGTISGTPTQTGTFTVTIEAYTQILTSYGGSFPPGTIFPSDSTTIIFNIVAGTRGLPHLYDFVNFN